MSGIADFLSSKVKDLTPVIWDSLLRFLDTRLKYVEEQVGVQKLVAEQLVQQGLQVIEDGIGPSVTLAATSAANVAAMADLGAVFFASTSTSMTINTNEKVMIIEADRRAQFAPAAFVHVYAGGDLSLGFVGRRLGGGIDAINPHQRVPGSSGRAGSGGLPDADGRLHVGATDLQRASLTLSTNTN